MKVYWLLFKRVREARHLRKQAWFLYHSQRDLLKPEARQRLEEALAAYKESVRAARRPEDVVEAASRLEATADRWLLPYPHPSLRENIKEFLVSGVFILAMFAFFLQPMKIPSGSAQPTLWGNVVTDLQKEPQARIPPWWRRCLDWFAGVSYYHWVAGDEGELEILPQKRVFGVIRIQTLRVGSDTYTFWWPPEKLQKWYNRRSGRFFRKGETVLKLRVSSGDRLFVDRLTYNFRRPKRGEIIVFSSHDIDRFLRVYRGFQVLMPNTHYIKRLIAKGGERVQIGDDRHVRINGARLDAGTPHFEKVYSFDPNQPPRENVYSGHVNEKIARLMGGRRGLAPLFPDEETVFVVRPKYYLAFGDNTMNSYDGRAWGDFPREKVVGRAFFVFWPFTKRFGPIEWW
ncbi:MAG: signal peptidase I [Verrucomicrobia bacterium]|nr:signal peptidase I [Verrucomicrobiota bacterium]